MGKARPCNGSRGSKAVRPTASEGGKVMLRMTMAHTCRSAKDARARMCGLTVNAHQDKLELA